MYMPRDPLIAFFELPDEVISWHEMEVAREQMRNGQAPNWERFWKKLTTSQQWQLVATLIDLSIPESPCPKFTPNKPIKSAEPMPQNAIEPVFNAPKSGADNFTDDSTEKVKQILLTRSKVRFIGEEGSGKTSKARWLCRERMALGHQIYWINPHLKADDKQKLDACNVTIVGGGRDYDAIARFCNKMVIGDDCKLSKEYARYGSEVGAKFEPITIVLDELTNYKDEVGEPIEKLIKASMQEFSKINWHTIYLTHNDTLSCMGAPAGTANLIKSSVFDLRLEADPLKGNRVPKAIAKYRMPNSDNWQDVTIPVEWQ